MLLRCLAAAISRIWFLIRAQFILLVIIYIVMYVVLPVPAQMKRRLAMRATLQRGLVVRVQRIKFLKVLNVFVLMVKWMMITAVVAMNVQMARNGMVNPVLVLLLKLKT